MCNEIRSLCPGADITLTNMDPIYVIYSSKPRRRHEDFPDIGAVAWVPGSCVLWPPSGSPLHSSFLSACCLFTSRGHTFIWHKYFLPTPKCPLFSPNSTLKPTPFLIHRSPAISDQRSSVSNILMLQKPGLW